MKKVVTAGEIVVEIMATKIGQSFLQSGLWAGPFPSGAPAIFINQVARFGQPCDMTSDALTHVQTADVITTVEYYKLPTL